MRYRARLGEQSTNVGDARSRASARTRFAAVLVVLAWAAWLHFWMPAALFVAFIGWVVLHKRLEGRPGDIVRRRWQAVWPPRRRVMAALLAVSVLTILAHDSSAVTKALPVGLHAIAMSVLLFGAWWSSALSALPAWLGGDGCLDPVTRDRPETVRSDSTTVATSSIAPRA